MRGDSGGPWAAASAGAPLTAVNLHIRPSGHPLRDEIPCQYLVRNPACICFISDLCRSWLVCLSAIHPAQRCSVVFNSINSLVCLIAGDVICAPGSLELSRLALRLVHRLHPLRQWDRPRSLPRGVLHLDAPQASQAPGPRRRRRLLLRRDAGRLVATRDFPLLAQNSKFLSATRHSADAHTSPAKPLQNRPQHHISRWCRSKVEFLPLREAHAAHPGLEEQLLVTTYMTGGAGGNEQRSAPQTRYVQAAARHPTQPHDGRRNGRHRHGQAGICRATAFQVVYLPAMLRRSLMLVTRSRPAPSACIRLGLLMRSQRAPSTHECLLPPECTRTVCRRPYRLRDEAVCCAGGRG